MMEIEESLEKAVTPNLRVDDESRALTESKYCSTVAADLFNCCICLDAAEDPVVTRCGHLYCWPCIYNWLHSNQNPTHADGQHSQCPVCAARISTATLVPIFCAGQQRRHCPNIPPRPINFSQDLGQKAGQFLVPALPEPPIGPQQLYVFGSLALMLRELSRERFLSDPNSYLLGRNCLPLGRGVVGLEESLRRMCFFLFCAMLACLLMF